jgi:hypothetical protein
VSHAPLSKDSSQALQGKAIVRTEYATPDFAAMTPGKAAFAILGAALMISEGNSIVKDNEIPDPAVVISKDLAKRLESARSVKIVEKPVSAKADDVSALVASGQVGDYVLDVKTLNWMFGYYPTNWSGYRVMYTARLRLIDTKTSAVVAETACKSTQGNDATPPSKDQLLENKAALLKELLGKAAVECVDTLAKDALMLS